MDTSRWYVLCTHPFLTKWLIPSNRGGCTYSFFILVRDEYTGVVRDALVIHEREHVRQWWTGGLFIHNLRYALSSSYRYQCELKAYAVQIKALPEEHRTHYLSYFSHYLATTYDLPVSKEQVHKDLLALIG